MTILPFLSRHNPTWRITDLQGSIIRLKEFKFVQIPTSPGAANNIVLVVEEFELVGSQGSATFGDPRYIMNNQSICQMLEEQGSKATSQMDVSFSENLDPADLLFLETTCTQTLERVRCSFPQVIKDSDWIIPDDQLRILENVDYGRLSKFEFQSDTEFFSAASSDIEASPVKRQQRSPQRAHTANESLTFTQTHSLPAMTQPFTQNSLVRGSQSPAKIRIIENLSPASPESYQRKNRSSPVKESSQATTLSQFSGSPKRTKFTDEPVEPTSSQKTLPVRFPSSPERKPPASPPRNALVEFPDYSAW